MRHKRHKEPFPSQVEKLMIDLRHARISLLEMHHHLNPYKNEYYDVCTQVIEEIDRLGVTFGFLEDHFYARPNAPTTMVDNA